MQWHPGGAGGGGEWVRSPANTPTSYFGRRRPSANRTMNAREAAHRLWPDKVAADPKDDPPPKAKSGSQVMDELLKAGRNKTRVNSTKDPLQ
jgi:hypothetical protein